MDKAKFPALRDFELVVGLSRHGAVVAARGWLAVLLVVISVLAAGVFFLAPGTQIAQFIQRITFF